MLAVILWSLLGLVAVCVLFLLICALLVDPGKEYETNSRFYRHILNAGAAVAIRCSRVRVHVKGLEKLPEGKRLLFVCNHISNYDPIITWWVLRKWDPAFISKPENFKIPLFGRMIRRCCFLPIDRQDPRKAMTTISEAAHLLEKGQVSVAIYPEGTRSKTGRLLPFHNGVFKIARKAEAQVVVLGISGTEKIHKNVPLRATHVYLEVLEVIGTEQVAASRTAELGDRARNQMENWLSEKREKGE